MVISFLFKKIINFFFIVMTVIAKGLYYFFSFIVFWVFFFLRRFFNLLNDFLATGSILFFSRKRFFVSSNVETTLSLSVSLICPMDTFMTPDSKWNSDMSVLFTLNLSFSPLCQNLDMLWSHCFFLLGIFGKRKKNITCFNLSLVIDFVLSSFVVCHIIIVTTSSSFSFFRSFPCFVWNFYCQ